VIAYERPVRFDEVDPAGLVFFARYMNFAHEAVENFFAELPGGYPALILGRKVGLPIVHLEADFRAPLRYGDELRVETSCEKVGRTSATLRHRIMRRSDRTACAELRQVVATISLETAKSCPMPDDVRRVLEAHRVDSE
jgi:4-hydroxybenzoyl-CoA thioesterase